MLLLRRLSEASPHGGVRDPPSLRASSSTQSLEPTFLTEALPVVSAEPLRAVAVIARLSGETQMAENGHVSQSRSGGPQLSTEENWGLP